MDHAKPRHFVDPHPLCQERFLGYVDAYALPVCGARGQEIRRTLFPEYVTCEACKALLPTLVLDDA